MHACIGMHFIGKMHACIDMHSMATVIDRHKFYFTVLKKKKIYTAFAGRARLGGSCKQKPKSTSHM